MRTNDAYGDLMAMGQPVVETREVAARLGTSLPSASRILRATENAGLSRQLRRGVWALDRELDPFVAAPYLTAPFPAYVSLWSALAQHGMIEQIPRSIYLVALDRSQEIETPIGTFSIHHLTPDLFEGFTGTPDSGYLATPEKALFDSIYVRAPQGGRPYFPELSLPASFDPAKFQSWLTAIPRPRLRTLVARGLDSAIEQASREE